jgi:hypothetical protein
MNDEKPWSLEDIRFVVKDEHGRALGKIGEYTVSNFTSTHWPGRMLMNPTWTRSN